MTPKDAREFPSPEEARRVSRVHEPSRASNRCHGCGLESPCSTRRLADAYSVVVEVLLDLGGALQGVDRLWEAVALAAEVRAIREKGEQGG